MSMHIPSLIEAAGGEIVGKVRLQKMIYLLSQLDNNVDFAFSYHHFGPYSDELADVVEDDVIFGRVKAEPRRRADGVPYVAYKSLVQDRDQNTLRRLDTPRIKFALAAMQRKSATVLELAATIHWLAFIEEIEDWRSELRRRKGVKTEQGRADSALALLGELGIAPA